MKTKPFNWGEWIEKYRFWIGGGLLLLILAEAGFQLYRENYIKPSYESRIMSQEERIASLEVKISKLQLTSSIDQSQNTDNSIQDTAGQVAGTSAQNTSNSGILNTSLPAGRQVQDDNKVTGKININTADSAGLESLTGIGPVTAKSILDYRAQNGPFKSINELDNVKGIGQKTIDKFRDQITI